MQRGWLLPSIEYRGDVCHESAIDRLRCECSAAMLAATFLNEVLDADDFHSHTHHTTAGHHVPPGGVRLLHCWQVGGGATSNPSTAVLDI